MYDFVIRPILEFQFDESLYIFDSDETSYIDQCEKMNKWLNDNCSFGHKEFPEWILPLFRNKETFDKLYDNSPNIIKKIAESARKYAIQNIHQEDLGYLLFYWK